MSVLDSYMPELEQLDIDHPAAQNGESAQHSQQHRQPKICPIAQLACLHFNGDNCDKKLECVYEATGKLRAGA